MSGGVGAAAVLLVAAALAAAGLLFTAPVLPASKVVASAGGSTMLLISRAVTSLAMVARSMQPRLRGQRTTWQGVQQEEAAQPKNVTVGGSSTVPQCYNGMEQHSWATL